MLSTGHSTGSRACLLKAVPQPSPGSPRRPACMAGNGPCRCACTDRPALYTTGSFLGAQVACQPAVPHHRLPTRGTQDGGHHSHSAGIGHQASPSSPTHAATQCIAAWRGTKFHRLQRSSHPCLTAASPGQTCRIARQEHITASWASNHCTTHPHCAGSWAAW